MPPETTDSAAGLAAAVLAASTPRAAAEAVSSAAAFLRRHHAGAADQPRAFFADALPALLFRLFVSRSPDSPCFLDLAARDPALAYLLESLLAPSGPLLVALSAADRHSRLRFTFPRERLPDWLGFALSSSTVTSSGQVISPLLAGRVGSKLHLSVFEYYLFWFAYHPIPAAAAKASATTSKPPPSTWKASLKPRARLESWVSTISPAARRNRDEKPHTSLYLRLLYAYLKEFVPSDCAPPRGGCGTLLHRNARDGVDAAESFRRAEFLVHALVQFWLVGNDFSPLPLQTSRAYGLPLLSLLSRANATLSERLPVPGLGDVVKLLVMYLNSSGVRKLADAHNVFDAMLSRKEPCDSPAGYWNPSMQRPLYRFVLRTLLFCPMGADIKNIAQVFSAWMVYLEPWKVQQDDLDKYDLPPPGGRNVRSVSDGKRPKCDAAYSPAWQGYVLSNYLFYSSLVVHFLGFAHKFIHSDVASVLEMVSKVSRDLSHHIFQKKLTFCSVESYP
jgi:sphingomyelin phosphodiesterase 4